MKVTPWWRKPSIREPTEKACVCACVHLCVCVSWAWQVIFKEAQVLTYANCTQCLPCNCHCFSMDSTEVLSCHGFPQVVFLSWHASLYDLWSFLRHLCYCIHVNHIFSIQGWGFPLELLGIKRWNVRWPELFSSIPSGCAYCELKTGLLDYVYIRLNNNNNSNKCNSPLCFGTIKYCRKPYFYDI